MSKESDAFFKSLDEMLYIIGKIAYKQLYSKELTRNEYKALLNEKIKLLKKEEGESND